MDLGAYAQIGDLEAIAKSNGIEVARLRGYRLMKDEAPLSKSELDDVVREHTMYEYDRLIHAVPTFDIYSYCTEISGRTKRLEKRYLRYDKDNFIPVGVVWDRIHGKHRKAMKYVARRAKKETLSQYALWNRFAGQENVLYIHARLGRTNISGCTWKDYESEPWFIDAIDDSYDSSYCDIYARINC